MGPGRAIYGDCRIARCCANKGHNACDGCNLNMRCEKYRGRSEEAQKRIIRRQEEHAYRKEIAQNAPAVSSWMSVLFWLLIPNLLGTVFTNETVRGWIPGLYTPGWFLKYVSNIVYAVVLLIMSKRAERYKMAGIFAIIASVGGILISPLATAEMAAAGIVFSIPLTVISFLAVYNEFHAHSEVMEGIDYNLSNSWAGIWKWYIGMYAAILGGVIITGIIPLLGIIVVFAGGIGLLIVGIICEAFLYESAKSARAYRYSTDD